MSALAQPFLDAWHLLRFLVFLVYMALAIVAIWVWALGAAIGFCRVGLRSAMLVLLSLSGGSRRRGRHDLPISERWRLALQALWDDRLAVYRDVAARLALQYVAWHSATRTFWHWTVGRKVVAAMLGGLFIGVPALFVVPRPHHVQITDDNAIHHEAGGTRVRYLVHAIDLDDPDQTREYENENAWWLGKVNPQGLKSMLKPGRFYRLWVVGVRWYYVPVSFPNIIWAVEISETSEQIEGRGKLLRSESPP